MNSAVSCSRRSAASATDLLTRAEASSTLWLKSVMTVLDSSERGRFHAPVAGARPDYYFPPSGDGQGRRILLVPDGMNIGAPNQRPPRSACGEPAVDFHDRIPA